MALVGTDVSEERVASIMRVKRIGELGTTLAVTSNRSTLRGLYWIDLAQGQVKRSCEYGNELSGSIKLGNYRMSV
jgi:hypothetical protein